MKIRALCLLAPLFLSACSTKVYRDGRLVLATHADARRITYRDDRIFFQAEELNHSRPTIAGGSSAAKVFDGAARLTTAVGAAVATRGVLPR